MNDRIWLSSPHMGGSEQKYVKEAFDTNWIAPLGPNVDSFEYVMNKNRLTANQTLFIDDSIQHIKGAKKAGLKAYHLKKNQDLVTSFPGIIQSTRLL